MNKIRLSFREKNAGPNLKFDLNRAIEIQNTVGKEGFHVLLFNLFMKAYPDNYEKLKSMYPQEAMEFEKYKQFGIDPSNEEISVTHDFE